MKKAFREYLFDEKHRVVIMNGGNYFSLQSFGQLKCFHWLASENSLIESAEELYFATFFLDFRMKLIASYGLRNSISLFAHQFVYRTLFVTSEGTTHFLPFFSFMTQKVPGYSFLPLNGTVNELARRGALLDLSVVSCSLPPIISRIHSSLISDCRHLI